MAAAVGAGTVVVHPPFRWQREYARSFESGIRELEQRTGVRLAVENMFPWRARNREILAYLPGWDPVGYDYANVTLDLSHTATSGSDALAMAEELGDRLVHVHLADGTGSAKDEHLVPGRGGAAVRRAAGAAGRAAVDRQRGGRGQHPPAPGPRRPARPTWPRRSRSPG